jgi:predicted nucleic acid-binding protein
VVFAREPDNIDVVWREETEYVPSGSNFWTDAYLAALARLTGYTLLTFDRGFSKYKKARVRILSRAS